MKCVTVGNNAEEICFVTSSSEVNVLAYKKIVWNIELLTSIYHYNDLAKDSFKSFKFVDIENLEENEKTNFNGLFLYYVQYRINILYKIVKFLIVYINSEDSNF